MRCRMARSRRIATYGIKPRTTWDAARFSTAFKARPFSDRMAGHNEDTQLRTKPALSPDQRARGALLHSIYALLASGERAGKNYPYHPKGSAPITVLTVQADGPLKDLARITSSDGSHNVEIAAVGRLGYIRNSGTTPSSSAPFPTPAVCSWRSSVTLPPTCGEGLARRSGGCRLCGRAPGPVLMN